MTLHVDQTACEWHEPALSDDAGPDTAEGRTCEWRGICECGWQGPWRTTSSAAGLAKRDYRLHVEAELGAEAYLTAPVKCRNCASVHDQGILMGTHVMANPCVRCGQTLLTPDNEAWDESKREAARWRF